MVDPLPLPSNFGELHEGALYFVPPSGKNLLLTHCGSLLDGCPCYGVNTAPGIFRRVNYDADSFPLGPEGVIRIASRPEGCPHGCSGPCVHLGRYNPDDLYRLSVADN